MAAPSPPDPVLVELTELVPALVEGDHAAFERVYVLTIGLVASVANGILRDRGAAEDVAQEVFLRLARHSTGLRDHDGRTLRAWLVSTTRNAAIDHVRRASTKHEQATDVLPDEIAADDTATDALGPSPALIEALGKLPDAQREALVLFHVGGLSGAEVAAALDRSRAATYTLLRRAERGMRSSLGPSDPGPTNRPLDTRRS